MNYYNSEPYKSIFDSKFYIPQGSLSAPTSIQTANQLAEVNARLNAGVSGVDLAPINPEVFEQIPKEHFKEINRLAKLSNATASLHGPVVDLAGFSQNKYDKELRKQTEEQLNYFIDRDHDLNPEGNTQINFHINTSIPGEIWKKATAEEKKDLNEKEVKELLEREMKSGRLKEDELRRIEQGEIKEAMGIVNVETGDLSLLRYEIKDTPRGKVIYTPEKRLESFNQTEWDKEKLRIFELQKQKEERETMLANNAQKYEFLEVKNKQEILSYEEKVELSRLRNASAIMQGHIIEINSHIETAINEMYNKSKKYSNPEEYKQTREKLKEQFEPIKDFYDKEKGLIDEFERARKARNEEKMSHIQEEYKNLENSKEETSKRLINYVNVLPTPDTWVPTNKLALEKTSETVANSAFAAFKKFGEHTPMITLENYQQDLTLGNADDLRNTIEKSRSMFAEKLASEKGISKSEARATAEKLIGVTWDVGHINFLRRKGYSEEEKLKQTKTIAPYVKQLHITDNFGFSDAHLPPGMGNSPIAQQLDILKRAGFKFEGDEAKGRVIIESGAFVQHFKENPHLYALEAFSSPLYTMKATPSWYQIRDTQGAYAIGLGNIYPEVHFRDVYGGGFASVPRELGGQFPGEKSRFAGTPNT